MHRRNSSVMPKIFVSIVIVIISLCSTFIALYVHGAYSHKNTIVERVAPRQVVHDAPSPVIVPPPVTLQIGSIDVSANVNPAGLTPSGDMDISDSPQEVAWYKLGPKPGEEGSAVIAGHYGWKDGVPSLFNNLNKLVKGDIVTTTDEHGDTKHFAVTRTALYAPSQDATDVFKSDDGKAHLNLITCQGTWVNTDKTYNERLIVFTDYLKK